MTPTPAELVASLLSGTWPTDESSLYTLLRESMTPEEAHRAVQQALDANTIRWVAFRGYCKGGRP